jgi:uncharacterized protein (DUF1778 family)
MPKKVRDEQLNIRVSGPLRSALEEAAAADERSLSDHVRQILIASATARVISRTTATTNEGVR